MKTLRFCVFTLVLGVATVACGDDEATPAAGSGKISTALLEYVPGDSPYVFAALEPQPAALQEKFEPMLEMAVDQYHNLFLQARSAMTKGDNESASDDLINVLDVLIEETEDGDLSGLGFDSKKDVPVIYGHGLLPVVRMTISDPDAWASTYARLTADLENAPTKITVDGLDIDVFGGDAPAQIFIAQQDGTVALSLGPADLAPAIIGELMGATKPAESIVDSGALAAVSQRYGFTPQMQGFVDFTKIFGMLQASGNPINDALFGSAPTLPLELDEICSQEMTGLVQIMPRMVVGATRIDEEGTDTLVVFEMREDVATALKPIAGTMAGLSTSTKAALKLGGAINLLGLRNWVETSLGAAAESPFECEQLVPLNEMVAQAVGATQQQLPPIVYNLQGYSIEIGSFEGMEGIAEQQMPENLELDLTVGFKNVEGLLMMGQMMAPQLAELALEPNGEAVPIPDGLAGPIPIDGFMAMTDDLISLSIGEDAESRAEARATATVDGETPLLTRMDIDAGAYFKFIAEMSESAMSPMMESDSLPEDQLKMLESQQANMRAMAEAYEAVLDRLSFEVVLTDRGLEMPATATFK
ncbi:MAG: hypothetical protein AAFR07_13140 [Pseudomonadota bacterium]